VKRGLERRQLDAMKHLGDIRGFLWLTQAKSVEKRGKEKSF
jgi:hypothetical protein